MNYKLLIGVLLVVNLLFANSFPETIDGTDLELVEYEGDLEEGGAAYYESSDGKDIVSVSITAISSSEWEDAIETAEYYGIDKKTEDGVDYYYICESAQYYDSSATGSYCSVVFYHNEMAYGVSAYSETASTSETLDLAITVGKRMMGSIWDQIFCCPAVLGLVALVPLGFLRSQKPLNTPGNK